MGFERVKMDLKRTWFSIFFLHFIGLLTQVEDVNNDLFYQQTKKSLSLI